MTDFKLKNIRYFDEMTEETPCFTAEIWASGKKVATVDNQGQGGGNRVIPAKGYTYQDVVVYDNLDVEADIFGMVYEYAEVKKHQSKGLVLKKDGSIFIQKFNMSITKLKKHPQYATWKTKQVAKLTEEGYDILNTNL